MKLAGYRSSEEAARKAYEISGIQPEEVDVVELHDCFTGKIFAYFSAMQKLYIFPKFFYERLQRSLSDILSESKKVDCY